MGISFGNQLFLRMQDLLVTSVSLPVTYTRSLLQDVHGGVFFRPVGPTAMRVLKGASVR